MESDDHICLCYRVSLGKIRAYLSREDPPVASLLSECLGAGTGCGWCVPYLKDLHAQHRRGQTPTIEGTPHDYEAGRLAYRATGSRTADAGDPDPGEPNPEEPGSEEPGPEPAGPDA